MTIDAEAKPKTKPQPKTATFIFIGDPNDNGAASRAPRDEDDEGVPAAEIYGHRFPKGKAVDVRLDAMIGDTHRTVVSKLRGNRHFFEGTEDELKAAKAAGEVSFKAQPKKVPVLVKNIGVRGLKQAGDKKPADDGDDE